MKNFYVTSEQLNEIIDSNLMLSTSDIPEYDNSEVSVSEPFDSDSKKLAKPTTTDDRAKSMAPGLYQRLVTRGVYGGPLI